VGATFAVGFAPSRRRDPRDKPEDDNVEMTMLDDGAQRWWTAGGFRGSRAIT
jgi:hypothetical protein